MADAVACVVLFAYASCMPKKQRIEDTLDVVATSFNFMKDAPVPLPGAEGFAVPRRFSAWVADADRGLLIGLALEVGERARIVDLAVQGAPVTPAELHDLPWGAYLDVALSKVMMRAARVPADGHRLIAPLSGGPEVAAALSAHKGYRRNRGRRPVDADRLRRVAELYREAVEQQVPIGDYISKAEGVSAGTARSLVARARKADLLPPASRGEG